MDLERDHNGVKTAWSISPRLKSLLKIKNIRNNGHICSSEPLKLLTNSLLVATICNLNEFRRPIQKHLLNHLKMLSILEWNLKIKQSSLLLSRTSVVLTRFRRNKLSHAGILRFKWQLKTILTSIVDSWHSLTVQWHHLEAVQIIAQPIVKFT